MALVSFRRAEARRRRNRRVVDQRTWCKSGCSALARTCVAGAGNGPTGCDCSEAGSLDRRRTGVAVRPRPTARGRWLIHGREHALPTARQPIACQRWTPLSWGRPGSTPTIPLMLPPTRERRLHRRHSDHQRSSCGVSGRAFVPERPGRLCICSRAFLPCCAALHSATSTSRANAQTLKRCSTTASAPLTRWTVVALPNGRPLAESYASRAQTRL